MVRVFSFLFSSASPPQKGLPSEGFRTWDRFLRLHAFSDPMSYGVVFAFYWNIQFKFPIIGNGQCNLLSPMYLGETSKFITAGCSQYAAAFNSYI